MRRPGQLKKEIETLFEKDKTLLLDVHNAKLVLRLMGRPPWNETGIIARQIHEELLITKAAVSGKVKRLLERGLIRSERRKPYYDPTPIRGRMIRDDRTKLLTLTKRGMKIAEYIEFYALPPKPIRKGRESVATRGSSYSREFHSARLRDLTERILAELPEVHATDIYSPSIVRPKQIYGGLQLSIEKDVLFSHLKKHQEFAEFVEFFKEFKMLSEEFKRKKDEALEGIEKDVSKHFNLEYSPQWEEADSFSKGMTKWIFDGGIHSLEQRREKSFEPYYVDIKSRLEEEKAGNQDLIQYWVGGTALVQTRKGNRQKEAFQKEIDDKLSDYMKGIEKAPYYSDIMEAQSLLERARGLGKRIELILRLNLEVAIFSDCEYTKAME